MNTEFVNVAKLSNSALALQYKHFMPTLYNNWVDVYYKGQRIAIINGFNSPLQWTAKNGSNIPNNIINYLETYCSNNAI